MTMKIAMRDRLDAARTTLRIDVVSDITCPWCAIGLHALDEAVRRLGDAGSVELQLHPFELNPDMPPEGEAIAHYASRKYGASADELRRRQALIHEHGAQVGFEFGTRTHVYNTFDAHRLLHWSGLEGKQVALKRALLVAYHRRGENPARHDVLLRAADEVGLDLNRARELLDSDTFANEVRASTQHWQQRGINSVPTMIFDQRVLTQGGHSVEGYEQLLRRIMSQAEPPFPRRGALPAVTA